MWEMKWKIVYIATIKLMKMSTKAKIFSWWYDLYTFLRDASKILVNNQIDLSVLLTVIMLRQMHHLSSSQVRLRWEESWHYNQDGAWW